MSVTIFLVVDEESDIVNYLIVFVFTICSIIPSEVLSAMENKTDILSKVKNKAVIKKKLLDQHIRPIKKTVGLQKNKSPSLLGNKKVIDLKNFDKLVIPGWKSLYRDSQNKTHPNYIQTEDTLLEISIDEKADYDKGKSYGVMLEGTSFDLTGEEPQKCWIS